MAKAKRVTEGSAKDPPVESTAYMTTSKALVRIRDLGIPVGDYFFKGLRTRREGPPMYFFGQRGLFRCTEFEAWLASYFRTETWDRRPKAKLKAKAKAKTQAKAGAGEQHAD
jgi:hypothetical protein